MKKSVLILCCAVLVLLAVIGGTMAFFTDAETKVNTFTVGDLDITLSESSWDDVSDGKLMIPGYKTEKNPTVTAVEGDSYMRLSLEFVSKDETVMSDERVAKIMQTINFEGNRGVNDNAFSKDDSRSTGTKHYYNYIGKFSEGAEVVLFDSVSIPSEWNQEDMNTLGEYEIVIRAEAIQYENFNSQEDAFSALDNEIETGTACENYKTIDNA